MKMKIDMISLAKMIVCVSVVLISRLVFKETVNFIEIVILFSVIGRDK